MICQMTSWTKPVIPLARWVVIFSNANGVWNPLRKNISLNCCRRMVEMYPQRPAKHSFRAEPFIV